MKEEAERWKGEEGREKDVRETMSCSVRATPSRSLAQGGTPESGSVASH